MKITPWIIAGAAFTLLFRIFRIAPRAAANAGITAQESKEEVPRQRERARGAGQRVAAKVKKVVKKSLKDQGEVELPARKVSGAVKKKASRTTKPVSHAAHAD